MHLFVFSLVPYEHDLAAAENAIATLNNEPIPHRHMICNLCSGSGATHSGFCMNCGGTGSKSLISKPCSHTR